MIHESSRPAVGWIEKNSKVHGHCVLIGPYQVVTCAHVVAEEIEQPGLELQLHFPILDFHPMAVASWWHQFDPTLARGSDIAILNFVGDMAANADTWVRIAKSRPECGDSIVALEYLTARRDGDLRKGLVFDSLGDVISLSDDQFVEPGMSGTGLFFPKHGERLLGLVSGRPWREGQTKGYAVPAEEILSLINEFDLSKLVFESPAPELATLIACAIDSTGDNFKGLLQGFVEQAMAALGKPKRTWREEDVNALLDLQAELADACSLDTDMLSSTMPHGVLATFEKIRSFCSEIGQLVGDTDKPVPLSDQMRKLLNKALSACNALLEDGPCPTNALQSLEQLRTLLKSGLVRGGIRFRQLSDRADLAARRAEGEFNTGVRYLLALIGERPDLAPPGTIFLDSSDPWAPEMVVVPLPAEGHFQMGSPQDEPGRFGDEERISVRQCSRFAIGRYALSFTEFDAYCIATGKDLHSDSGWGQELHPAINVSWFDAVAWCEWASEQSRARYQLPTEAEWEYSCRADQSGQSMTPFCVDVAHVGMGNYITPDEANFDGTEVFNGSAVGKNRAQTVAVNCSEFQPNSFGLWQMHGNTDEWCLDKYEEQYRQAIKSRENADGTVLQSDGARVVRGGNWYNNPKNLRASFRCKDAPDDRSDSIGFRPIRQLS